MTGLISRFDDSRVKSAALIGIGGASFFIYKKGIEAFNALLILKILWSIAAIIAIAISIIEGGPQSEWLFLAIFVVFSAIWMIICLLPWLEGRLSVSSTSLVISWAVLQGNIHVRRTFGISATHLSQHVQDPVVRRKGFFLQV
jgi:hypothetical protein